MEVAANRIKTLIAAAAVLGSVVAAPVAAHSSTVRSPTCGGEQLKKPDGTPWRCTLDDEFDGTKLDRARWAPQLTANSDYTTGTPPYRACYVDNSKTVSVSNGYLHLSVVRTPAAFTCTAPSLYGLAADDFTTHYQAGEVTTYYSFAQTYGRFEVRAKLPPATVKGLQETLWLWPKNDTKYGAFPDSGEIDFAEFYSSYSDRVIPYIHYDYKTSTVSKPTNTNIVTNDYTCLINAKKFNIYAVVWQPGRITLTYNGKTCLVDNYQPSNIASPAPFDQPFFLALTQALGVNGNAPTTNTRIPATTLIDYVRVWK